MSDTEAAEATSSLLTGLIQSILVFLARWIMVRCKDPSTVISGVNEMWQPLSGSTGRQILRHIWSGNT